MIRKLDQQQGILFCVHVVMNLGAFPKDGQPCFTIGILSDDDVRARVVLGVFLVVPPIFHKRSEVTLKESKWRTDPGSAMRYLANVHSAMAAQKCSGEAYRLKFEPSVNVVASRKPGLDSWWASTDEEPPVG